MTDTQDPKKPPPAAEAEQTKSAPAAVGGYAAKMKSKIDNKKRRKRAMR
jgi:hypothetical protein